MGNETTNGSTSNALAPAAVTQPGSISRQEFGAQQFEMTGETAATAAAATARALVEARFIMAMRRPRDWDDVRSKIMRSIERPGFAGKAGQDTRPGEAWFRKPIGAGVEGFSIRFAEECLRALGNIDVRPTVTYDDAAKRVVDVMVMDLESNICFTSSVVVPKTVERASLKEGETALSMRLNSKNRPVYTRAATEDEILQTQNVLISKIMRNEILRLVPGDVLADARARIIEIRQGDAASNPDGVRKEVADAFAALNVPPSGLKQLLGHELAGATPAELADLRALYKAIREGSTTWHAVLTEALAERGEDAPAEGAAAKPGLAGLTEKLKAQAATAPAPGGLGDPTGPPPPKKDPKDCGHPAVPPSKVDALPSGQSIACPDCEAQLTPTMQREPGQDDEVPVQPEKKPQGRQRKLEE